MATLKFIPNTVSKKSAAESLTMEDIPQDVRDDVEGAYAALKTQPGRFAAEFATLAELTTYVSQVTAYCALRMVDGKPAPIRFRKSPTRGLKPTQMEFRITDLKTEAEQTTDEIRDAVDAVKTEARKTPAK